MPYFSAAPGRRARLTVSCYALLLALLLARPVLAQTTSFGCTGSPQYYTVPANVTQLVVVATGAYNGATVRATVAVTPGETLTAVVGYRGLNSFAGPSGGGNPITGITPGYNGGGFDGSTYYYSALSVGGGATDLRRSGTSTGDYLNSRNALLVAGGGGSGCDNDPQSPNYFTSTCMGGGGGTPNGGNGTGTSPGAGATQTGVGSSTGSPASNNVGGVGNNYGGSGGGGYYGGGSGTGSGTGTSLRTGGGGGGSSWVMAGSSAGSYGSGGGNSDGSMTITPVAPVLTAAPALTAPANGSTVATATPTYSGTAPAGSTVRLYVDGSATPLTTTATTGGTFSLAQPTALAQASHTVYATAQGSGEVVSAASATNTFTVRLVPTITNFSPTSGVAGTPVTLTGTDLAGASSVSVNGVAVTPTSVTSTSLVFGVPAGASATQSITVTTPTLGTGPPSTAFTVRLQVASASPAANARTAPLANSAVALTFTEPVTAASAANVRVYSAQAGGRKAGTLTVSGNTARFAATGGTPRTNFKPGETVRVSVPATVRGVGGLAVNKRVYQFTTAVSTNGRGVFAGGSDPAVGNTPLSVAVGDVDGDGDLDLLAANSNDNTVSVRLNGGDATGSNTGIFSGGSDPAVGSGPTSVELGDVDGDGDLDLLAANSNNNTVSVRLNGGDATGSNTGVFSGGSNPAVGSSPQSVAVGDVDGDGDLDFVTANFRSKTVSVRLNGGDATGSNTGVFSGGSNPAVDNSPQSVAVGDVDGDGDLDFVTANFRSSTVSVRLNGGDATGSNTGVFSAGADVVVGIGPFSVAVGDVDGDGDLDFVTANQGSNTISVRLNGGDATGSNTGVFSGGSDPAAGGGTRSVAMGDVDGDGDLDLLTANNLSNTASVRLNGGDATGSNTGVFAGGSDPAVGSGPTSVALADVDGDGDLDLLAANGNASGTVSVRLNQPPLPAITNFTPPSGPVGTSVTITGTGLGSASSVSFNGGVQTTITANSTTSLTVAVPASATTGPVTVTTASGTSPASAQTFTVVPSLSNLVLSAGSLSPAFDPTTLSYTLTVPGTTTSTTVTPTQPRTAAGIILTVNGTAVASGAASAAIALAPGSNTLTIVVSSPGGGAPTTTYTVTVTRTCAVTATAQNASVTLDASGNATVAATAVNNGSSSTCGAVALALSQTAFTCANVGANAVTLTVTDGFGGSATAPATVTVTDGMAPTALAQAVAVSVAANGRVYVAPTAVNNGSSDNCGVTNVALSASSFGSCNASTALAFDGTDDYVSLPHNAAYNVTTAITLEAWVKTSSSGEQYITTKSDDSWYLAVNGGAAGAGKVTFYLNGVSPGSGGWLAGATTVSDGNWHHVAGTYDGATLRIYVDGVLDASRSVVGTVPTGTSPVFVGSRATSLYWNGSLDEVRIWSVARTAAELNLYKDKSLAGTTAGLLAYLDFNDGPGSTTVTNRGSVGGVGILNNFATATAFVSPGQVPALGIGAQTVTLTVSDKAGNVSSTTATVTVSVPTPTVATWTGAASTDWTSCANWQYGTLPSATVSAVLPAAMPRYPSLPAGTYPVLDLTLASGSSLATASTATLQLSGSFANNGGTASLAGPVVFTGTAAQSIGGSSATAFATVTVNKASGSVSLGRDLAISSALTLTSGVLTMGTPYKIALSNTATISETETSYVSGAVETTRVLSTAGSGSSFGGIGVTLTPAASSTALPGSTLVRRLTGTPATGMSSSQGIARYFVIAPTVDANLNLTLVFGYRDGELNGIPENRLKLFKSATGAAGPWARIDYATYNATANTVTCTNIASLSTWTLGNADAPLPVELLAFNAEKQGTAVQLKWQTASERNSARFEVERSRDGRTFGRIGTVAAQGNTSRPSDYAFLDSQYPGETNVLYYRLRQVDLEGPASYSPVRAVQFLGSPAPQLTLFPNPAHGAVQVLNAPAGAVVEVFDALGRAVARATAGADGRARLVLPAGLAAGMYTVKSGAAALRLAVE